MCTGTRTSCGVCFPSLLLSTEERSECCGYPADAPPVFCGHYGYLKPPEPLARNVACVDLGVIRGGALCAYRWDGEAELDAAKFLWVRPEAKAPLDFAATLTNDEHLLAEHPKAARLLTLEAQQKFPRISQAEIRRQGAEEIRFRLRGPETAVDRILEELT